MGKARDKKMSVLHGRDTPPDILISPSITEGREGRFLRLGFVRDAGFSGIWGE
jgi:hypothetical protein